MELDPPPPVHMRPPEPDPLPLRVDVINGCPLINSCAERKTLWENCQSGGQGIETDNSCCGHLVHGRCMNPSAIKSNVCLLALHTVNSSLALRQASPKKCLAVKDPPLCLIGRHL